MAKAELLDKKSVDSSDNETAFGNRHKREKYLELGVRLYDYSKDMSSRAATPLDDEYRGLFLLLS
jgi:hypothetical protein